MVHTTGNPPARRSFPGLSIQASLELRASSFELRASSPASARAESVQLHRSGEDLLGEVARAHVRAAGDVAEPRLAAPPLVDRELLGRDEADDVVVLEAGAQVLADGHDVDLGRA